MSEQLPSPSQHERVSECITSEALPHARSTSEASQAGTAMHAFLANVVNHGKDKALEMADPEDREAFEAIPLDRLPDLDASQYVAEVSFALNIATGEAREIGRNLERAEAQSLAKPGEMVGTADLAGVTPDTFVCFDWKRGIGNHVSRAEVNKQMRAYLLQGARTYHREKAIGFIVRMPEGGDPWFDRVEMDAFDLDSHEVELRELMAERQRVLALPAAERPPLHEGPWCRYCPALAYCPAKVTLLATTFDGDLGELAVELTPERAARAWGKINQAEKLLERLKAIVKDYGRQSPFPTEEGYEVGEVTKHRETLVPERAQRVLKEYLDEQMGSVIYAEAVEVKAELTKTALKAAVRKHLLPTLPKERQKITTVQRDVEEALRKGGAVSVSSFKCVEEHKVEKALPAEVEVQAEEAA